VIVIEQHHIALRHASVHNVIRRVDRHGRIDRHRDDMLTRHTIAPPA